MTYQCQPISIPRSERFRVECGGRELAVYSGADFDYVHVITSDIEALTVSMSEDVKTVDIRPARRGKKFTRVDDHTVTLRWLAEIISPLSSTAILRDPCSFLRTSIFP